MMKFGILFALVAAATADSVTQFNPLRPNGRIVGGQNVSIELAPHQVSLRYFGSHVCGGSIIAASWILTAAHCPSGLPIFHTIRSGSSLSNSGGSITVVIQFIIHNDYGRDIYGRLINDIALAKLITELIMGPTRAPIGMYGSTEQVVVGSSALVSGWGPLSEEGISSTVLQAVNVPIFANAVCNTAYGELPNSTICAGGDHGFCQSDSGGPLVIDGRLAGIVSYSYGCGRSEYPGVYTAVASYRTWIAIHTPIPPQNAAP